MWGTAKLTAKQMGIQGLRKEDLGDPTINLAIGSTYLAMMLKQFDGNIPCALAAYNAGPGAVERWLTARSGYPVDEWVEDIPYKETRGYVPRVIDSYQTYSHLDGDQVFVDLPLTVPTR
jgi:soluble lytic murein transglycosylase